MLLIMKKAYSLTKNYINKLTFYFGKLLPIESNLIVLESEGDFSDNAEALFNYMNLNNYLKQYKVIWLVKEPSNFRYRIFNNTKFVSKNFKYPCIKAMYYLARCKFYIYDHNNLLQIMKVKKRTDQHIIYMSHGTAFKDGKNEDPNANKYFDKVVTLGKMSTDIICHFWKCEKTKAIELGETREDYYYSDLGSTNKKLNKFYQLDEFRTKILWMPTFRQSDNPRISENYLNNETGLPIFNKNNDLYMLNSFLENNNACLLLKVHHLQAKLPVFNEKFSNIKIILDTDLERFGVKLYKFIAISDALITDYSSISVDYLPLNKPIIYTLDDFDEYKASRGIYPDNARDYMPGDHVYNIEEFNEAIQNVIDGNDRYSDARSKVKNLFYSYEPGKASERLLNYLKIKRP